jgi:hypothetical protein
MVFRLGNVVTIYPAKMNIREMADRLRALPAPPAIEARDTDEFS